MEVPSDAPIIISLCGKYCSLGRYQKTFYQASTLSLTFVAYASYHLSRRPLAVAKNALNTNCSLLTPPSNIHIDASNKDNWCDWVPFEKKDANQLLGYLDFIYIGSYAMFMYLSGFIAERMSLRYFLSFGMLLCGVFTYLFGIAYYLNIHSYAYFAIIQFLGGAVESTGWPGVVACVGNWFGKTRRGLIFGTWNAHLFVGNILGAYVAGHFVADNWGLCFIIPAAIIGVVGFLMFLFLVPNPSDVGCSPTVYNEPLISKTRDKPPPPPPVPAEETDDTNKPPLPSSSNPEEESLLSEDVSNPTETHIEDPVTPAPSSNAPAIDESRQNSQAISFGNAFKIPGVVDFSLCLFFSKLVSYTFMFWLPRYLAHSTGRDAQQAAYLSIAFDVGGIIGGVTAGAVSDRTEASAITCMGFLAASIPWLFLFHAYGADCAAASVLLQLICGSLVNGPYALITTAVSAELGTHPILRGSARAVATVTAIIDGTGSIGAAIGPLLAGLVSEYSWDYVFYAMMISNFLAMLSLMRIGGKELNRLCAVKYGWCSFVPLSPCCACWPISRQSSYESVR